MDRNVSWFGRLKNRNPLKLITFLIRIILNGNIIRLPELNRG